MKLSEINPFLRFAELQPSVMSSAPFKCSYDYRLFYILDGNAELVLADRTVDLTGGTLLYFRPGTPYYFNGKVKVIVLNFDLTRDHAHVTEPARPRGLSEFSHGDIIENEPPAELSALIAVQNAFEIEEKLQQCITHFRFPTAVSDAITSALIKEILCHAVQNSAKAPNELPEAVRKIIEYIRNNYDKELGNETISAVFGYHSFYLNRMFKKHTGLTLHQAVLKERVRIAKRLLGNTALSVEEIVKEAGFSDRVQLCGTFKKETGMTPTEYRKSKQRA